MGLFQLDVFFKHFWLYYTEHHCSVVWHQLSLWCIVQKALTLITSSWVTASIAWMTASGGWYAPVVRAWAPISSNKMSELSIDIKYSVFTWVLHIEEMSENIGVAVPAELHHGNLCHRMLIGGLTLLSRRRPLIRFPQPHLSFEQRQLGSPTEEDNNKQESIEI